MDDSQEDNKEAMLQAVLQSTRVQQLVLEEIDVVCDDFLIQDARLQSRSDEEVMETVLTRQVSPEMIHNLRAAYMAFKNKVQVEEQSTCLEMINAEKVDLRPSREDLSIFLKNNVQEEEVVPIPCREMKVISCQCGDAESDA